MTTLGLIIAIVLYALEWVILGKPGGAIDGAICGVIGIGAAAGILKILSKNKEAYKSVAYTFNRSEIASVEDGTRGINKMIVIKPQNGELCKINPQGNGRKEAWKNALNK
jgi:hypothetical protein